MPVSGSVEKLQSWDIQMRQPGLAVIFLSATNTCYVARTGVYSPPPFSLIRGNDMG